MWRLSCRASVVATVRVDDDYKVYLQMQVNCQDVASDLASGIKAMQ